MVIALFGYGHGSGLNHDLPCRAILVWANFDGIEMITVECLPFLVTMPHGGIMKSLRVKVD